METFFGFVMLFGALGTSTYYWFARGRSEQNIFIARFKTAMVFMFWYAYLAWMVFDRQRSTGRRSEAAEAKSRILG